MTKWTSLHGHIVSYTEESKIVTVVLPNLGFRQKIFWPEKTLVNDSIRG